MKRDLTPAQLAQEVTVTLPLSALLSIGEPPAALAPAQPIALAMNLPAIGEKWNDGIYAGLTIFEGQPQALILLPGDEKKTWSEGIAWAESIGGRLPTRIDQLVLFQNLKSEFKSEWHWSGEQYAGDGAYAWGQGFSGGGQTSGHKDDDYRCRAVRSLPIR